MESTSVSKSHRQDLFVWGLVLLLTLIGLGLRWYRIMEYELWTDELNALRTSRDWETIRRDCLVWLSSPPTRYALTSLFIHWFFEPNMMRIPSLIAGTLTLPLLAWVAWRWWGRTAAVVAASIATFNPWLIAHSQDGRMHVVALFFCLLAVALCVPPIPRFRRTSLVLAGLCLAVSSSITYPAMLVCAGVLALFLVASWGAYPSWKPLAKDSLWLVSPWALWVVVWFSVVLYNAPSSPLFPAPPPPLVAVEEVVAEKPTEAEVEDGEESEAAPARPMAHIAFHQPPPIWTPAFYLESLRGQFGDTPLRWATLLGALAFVLLPMGQRGPNRLARLTLIAVPMLLAISQRPSQIYPRYGLALLPYALLGLGQLAIFLGRKPLGIGLLLALVLGLSIPASTQILRHSPQPWRAALNFIGDQWVPTDRLLVGTHQAEFGVFLYKPERILRESIVWRSFTGGRLQTHTLDDPNRTWLIQWFGFPESAREMLLRYYEEVGYFPGRYGTITVYRKKEGVGIQPEEEEEDVPLTEGVSSP